MGVDLPYDDSRWVKMSWIDIDAFHPVKFGWLETLNWLGTVLLSMQKHALLMLVNDKK
jgi:hypothetical protein